MWDIPLMKLIFIFTQKIEDVLRTPKPQTHKDLKSFLGLCIQLSEHITS